MRHEPTKPADQARRTRIAATYLDEKADGRRGRHSGLRAVIIHLQPSLNGEL